MPLTQRLRQLRGNRSQREVAQALGVTRSAYSMYEIGARTPDEALIVRIADYFQVTTDYLLGRTDERAVFRPRPAGLASESRGSFKPGRIPDEHFEAILRQRGLNQDDIELVHLLEERRRREKATREGKKDPL